MSILQVEERLAHLEAEAAVIKARASRQTENQPPWWEQITGVFKDDPLFDEAEKQGRAWRDSQRPEEDGPTDVSAGHRVNNRCPEINILE